MRATTVRFRDDLWDLLEAEAAGQGTSAAQFVRDAVILRLGYLSAQRGDSGATITLEDLAAGALAGRGSVVKAAGSPDAVHDPGRLDALRRVGLLDTPREEAYDRLTRLAAKLLGAPVALISLVDDERQFFKSCLGLEEPWASARETPLSHSFCQYAVAEGEPLVIEDAREHPLVQDNLAIRDLNVVAYAGIPLIRPGGEALGTLCVIDHKPRVWTKDQLDILTDLAASVLSEIELHVARIGFDD